MLKENQKNHNVAKNAVALIVLIVWVASLVIRGIDGTSLPFSVEVGFLVVLGYIFGNKAFESLKDFWRKK